MKTVLYASLSANGYLIQASAEHPSPPEIMQDLMTHVGRHKNLVIGRQTYELMRQVSSPEAFASFELVVVSGKEQETPGANRVDSPQAALDHLRQKGTETAFVAGGGKLYSSFLSAGLVDEAYINITPVLTGKGISIPAADDAHTMLHLLDTSKLTADVVQLHYEVTR